MDAETMLLDAPLESEKYQNTYLLLRRMDDRKRTWHASPLYRAEHRGSRSRGVFSIMHDVVPIFEIYLESTLKCGHQNGEEKKCATTIKRSSVVLEIVEDTADNKSHDSISNETREHKTHVPLETLESTVDTKFDLHGDRDGIRRFDTSRLELVRGYINKWGILAHWDFA
jgi:hypothetical protein